MGVTNIGRVVGKSAYEIAVEEGYSGTESQWAESLKLHLNDLTESEIAMLQKPASDAAEYLRIEEQQRINNESARIVSETARESAEEQRQTQSNDAIERVNTAIENIEAPSNGKVYARKDSDWVQTYDKTYIDSKLDGKLDRFTSELEELLAYGIQFDTTISTPDCTRIGNLSLHRTLPIHIRMRGCLLNDDGEVNEYLPSTDWTNSTRDGSEGQVMVEIPAHYRKFVTIETVRQIWISEHPIVGYHLVPKMYVSAYEAALQRSNTTLCSVVNTNTNYRGGDNNTTTDSAANTLLGRPVTNTSLTNFRSFARNRNNNATSEWNCYTYEAQKTIYWLFTIEYATRNSQLAINSALTNDGFKQGGLGNGCTDIGMSNWTTFNNQSPFIPCGHTDSLGNNTGEVEYSATANGTTLTTNVNRYRGIENPFGHLYKWTDGILVDVKTDANGGTSNMYATDNPTLFSSTSFSNYSFRGKQARTISGYIKDIIFGEFGDIIASEASNGSSSTYFCDNSYTSIETNEIKGIRFGGYALHDTTAGLACSAASFTPSRSTNSIGSRLCFHPIN